jgi:uncharacterized protein (TIGR04255 family)
VNYQPMTKIKFENPPITELVIGVYFERDLPSLRVEHAGLFWSEIRDEFPTVSQHPVVSPSPPGGQFPTGDEFVFEPFPMPRFWFEAADGISLMQVQKNAFIFNWRKRDADYPHFETVKSSFDKYFGMFIEFLLREGNAMPSARILELTYVNTLQQSEYWTSLRDTNRVIPLFHLPIQEDADAAPSDFHQLSVQRLAPDLSLHTTVRSTRSTKDATKPSLVFELRAIGLLDDAMKRDVDQWFDRAHDTIGTCFLSMTSPDIQRRYWKPV